MDNPVAEEVVIVEVEPSLETKHSTLNFAVMILLKIANQLEPLGVLWINYHPHIFGEEAVIMLPSPLSFIIVGLYTFAKIKSQGYEFPFRTHPGSVNVAITSMLFYGLASAAEHFISTIRLPPPSVYAIIARLGRIGFFLFWWHLCHLCYVFDISISLT
ncbi:unnamed protein product [Lactuca saligna]|uniref:Uncharacterized protein n=1 Tax=Lactuca saligna TaxID=75948 RepID=A0AA36ECR9_LACSI|nr:unnamed protein product [Lactuca saligna]